MINLTYTKITKNQILKLNSRKTRKILLLKYHNKSIFEQK